jgi:hypothetical protein
MTVLNRNVIAIPLFDEERVLLTKGSAMDPETVTKALQAIEDGDGQFALELLKEILLYASAPDAADAEAESVTADDPDGADAAGDGGSEGDGAEGIAPPGRAKERVTDPEVKAERTERPRVDRNAIARGLASGMAWTPERK